MLEILKIEYPKSYGILKSLRSDIIEVKKDNQNNFIFTLKDDANDKINKESTEDQKLIPLLFRNNDELRNVFSHNFFNSFRYPGNIYKYLTTFQAQELTDELLERHRKEYFGDKNRRLAKLAEWIKQGDLSKIEFWIENYNNRLTKDELSKMVNARFEIIYISSKNNNEDNFKSIIEYFKRLPDTQFSKDHKKSNHFLFEFFKTYILDRIKDPLGDKCHEIDFLEYIKTHNLLNDIVLSENDLSEISNYALSNYFKTCEKYNLSFVYQLLTIGSTEPIKNGNFQDQFIKFAQKCEHNDVLIFLKSLIDNNGIKKILTIFSTKKEAIEYVKTNLYRIKDNEKQSFINLL